MLAGGSKFALAFCVVLALSFNGVVKHAESSPIYSTRDFTRETDETIQKVNIDEVIDDNIGFIQSIFGKLDPMAIDDTKISATKHIYMDLSNGWMQNLALVRRSGACILIYTSSSMEKILTVDLNLGWDSLTFDFRYFMKVLIGHRKGDLHGQFSQLKIRIIADIDLNEYKFVFKKLEIVNAGKITLKLEGHLSDKLYNLVIKAATKVLNKKIVKTINEKITEMLKRKSAGILTNV